VVEGGDLMAFVFLVAQKWWNKSRVFEKLSNVGEGFLKYPSTKSAHWDDFSGSAGPVTAAVPALKIRSLLVDRDSWQCRGVSTGSAGVQPPAVPACNHRQCRPLEIFCPTLFTFLRGSILSDVILFLYLSHT
jgi:hypothetical protein